MVFRKQLEGWPYIMPGAVAILAIIAWPLLAALYYSFFNLFLYKFFDQRVFVGFENYIKFFKDKFFLNSFNLTLLYTFLVAVFCLVIGLMIALLLNIDYVRAKNIFITFFIIPFVISPIVGGIIWRYFMFPPKWGILNSILDIFGIQGPGWITDPKTGMLSIVIVAVWNLTPFVILVLYAGLTIIPEDLVDAAKIDGASSLRIFKHIILPFLRPHILFSTLIIMTGAFRQFDQVWALTGGGPARSTELLSVLIYRLGFETKNIGVANAIAFFMFLVLSTLCFLYIKVFNLKKEE